jgi:hypothetical protein
LENPKNSLSLPAVRLIRHVKTSVPRLPSSAYMEYSSLSPTVQLLAGAVIVSLLIGAVARKGHASYPGPRGWPVIGNLLDLRSTQPALKHPGKAFRQWGQRYGESWSDLDCIKLSYLWA